MRQDRIAEALAPRFEKIVNQMETITNLVQRLDDKISKNEENIREIMEVGR